MENNSKGNDNFATIVMSMKNVKKRNEKEVRRKNQTYFFSKLLTWETSLKLPSPNRSSKYKILSQNISIKVNLDLLRKCEYKTS